MSTEYKLLGLLAPKYLTTQGNLSTPSIYYSRYFVNWIQVTMSTEYKLLGNRFQNNLSSGYKLLTLLSTEGTLSTGHNLHCLLNTKYSVHWLQRTLSSVYKVLCLLAAKYSVFGLQSAK